MAPTLCQNPDCGAMSEEEGMPHLDKDTGEIVTLCPTCTVQVRESNHHRYERVEKEESDERQ